MQCRVDGCGRDAQYKTAQLCQMHYFRMRRNGSVAKKLSSRQQRIITPNGYVRIFEPGHALADKGGYVFEHRQVMWAIAGLTAGRASCAGRLRPGQPAMSITRTMIARTMLRETSEFSAVAAT